MGSILIIAILLLITAAVALPLVIDPNDYKEQISDTIKEQTGLTLAIDGNLSLSVFPWLGIKTEQVTISQPDIVLTSMPEAAPLISVEAISVGVKLLPLLNKAIEVDTVLLQKPEITFLVTATGSDSLASINGSSSEETSENKSSDSTQAIAALSIAGMDITDGKVTYSNQQEKTNFILENLNINSGDLLSQQAVPFSLTATISGQDITPTDITLDSKVALNKDALAISISDFVTSVTQQNVNNADSVEVTTEFDTFDYQHQAGTSSIKSLTITGKMGDIPFSGSIPSTDISLEQKSVSIPEFTIDSLGIKTSGDVSLKNWDGMGMAIGHIHVAPFDAKEVLQKLKIDYSPKQASALDRVELTSGFNGTANGLSLNKTTVSIDNTELTGDISIIDYTNPKYQFDLSLSAINIDNYLPAQQASTNNNNETQTSVDTTEALRALAAPIALLQSIYANGVFRAQDLMASNIQIDNAVITVASNQQTTTITPAIKLYKGSLDGKMTVDKTPDPTLSIISTLKNIQLEPLLIDADITDQFSGTANIDKNITVTNVASSKPTVTGSMRVVAKDGAIKGIDIKKILDDSQAKIDALRGKQTPTANTTEDKTRFAEMSATLLIDNHIITNNDLSIKAPVSRITGKGTVDIQQQTLDYASTITVVNTNEGQGGKEANDLKGITIPVRFTGPLTSPNYQIDFEALLKANSSQKLEQEKDKLKNKLLDKLGVDSNDNDKPASTQAIKEQAKDKLEDKLKEKLFDKLFK